jgi:predicted DCC family thiol-disulfide oxidoreductase YuxK
MTEHKAIILFDGVCNLCDRSVQFILKRDKKGYFQFASLQSEAGQALLQKYNLPTEDFGSFVLIEKGKAYQKSTGALRVCRHLGAAWPLMYGFIIIPPFIRHAVYTLLARNRYRWFGKKEACMMPQPEWKERFL